MVPTSLTSTLKMGNSVKIPQIGFGVYLSPKDTCVKSCLTALELGYRHIDTAQYYENEEEVGQAVQESGIPRKHIFLTTKILLAGGSVDKSYESCVESVKKLDSDASGYADLFLIHNVTFGAAKRKEVWLALERLYAEGKAKSIGVSNYGIQHIEEMRQFAQVWPPHVNQIEVRFSLSSPLFWYFTLWRETLLTRRALIAAPLGAAT
jgi:diketogulonate reductase-like aldo/keto reductase